MTPRPLASFVARLRGRAIHPFVAIVALALLSALGATPALAQVQMNCIAVPVPSAYPADWRSSHSLCQLQLTNNLREPVRCDLRARLDQPGGSAGTTEPRVFAPGQTVLLTQNILDWGRLAFQGSIREAMDRTGHLPARPVRITLFCENMVGANSGVAIPDVQIEITIVPSIPPAPTLLTPPEAGVVRSPAPVFTWTPTRLTTGQEVWYQFRMVRVLPGQSAATALEANVPLLETFVARANLPYPSAAPRFEDGATYAWRVQALLDASTGVGKRPVAGRFVGVGLNEGRSPVRTFLWQSPDAGTSARMRAASGPGDMGSAGSALLGVAPGGESVPDAARARPAGSSTRRIVSPSDSIARALLTPRGDWWGPRSGGRGGPFGSATTAGTLSVGDSASAPGDGADAASGGAGAAPGASATPATVPYGPIQVDPGMPEGAGLATRWFRVAGTSVAAGELYEHKGAGLPSRPDESGQLTVGATLSMFGDRVKVPVRALVSGDQVSFRQTINQLSLHPEWRWGGFHAGNVRPGYSRFSLADAGVLGGGADIVRDGWYVGGVAGRMRQSIRRDTIHAVEPQFERNVVAGRVGIGKPLGNAIEFVVMRALDDRGSLPTDSLLRVTPAANTVFEARARRAVLDSGTTVHVDAALSRFDRNVRADAPTVSGLALGTRIERHSPDGELGFAVDYTGGGFQSFGNSELAPDRIEGRLNGRRVLQQGRLRLGGALGLRRDDISGTLGGETRRRSLGVQAGWQPNATLGSDVDLGVLASHSPATELRQALKDLTASFSLSPRLAWNWGGSAQNLNTTLAVQSVQFSGDGALGFAGSRTTTVAVGWQGGLSNTLYLSASGNYVRSKVADQVTELGAWGPGVSLTLLGGRAQANLQLQVTQTHVLGTTMDRELTPNIDARWVVNDRQSLVFRATTRRYRTGANDLGDFDERMATLQYSASL